MIRISDNVERQAMQTITRRPPRLAAVASLTIAALLALGGCASSGRSANDDPYYDSPRSVSAREYGYVRPNVDVRVVGSESRTFGYSPSSYRGNDLWERVRRSRGLGVTDNPRVDRAIAALKRNPKYLTDLSRRARPYLHMIVHEVERRGMPAELALLPEVESRYNPRAISPVAATGMWQFMPYTGKEMGLDQNSWYDGRNDILASTRGALSYLQQLRAELGGDWALALAAYNCGPRRVASAQERNRRRGKPTDFWSLDLPAETEAYVPKLLAVAALVKEPGRYGQRLPVIPNRPALEVVASSAQIDLAHAARVSGVSLKTLRDLNPGLKRGKTMPSGPHQVLVPVDAATKLRKAIAKAGKAVGSEVASRDDGMIGGS
jgi:membrane-bound lytic murein transglycosylase D